MKLVIKEPTDKEFEAFKNDFLKKQAEKNMGSHVKNTVSKFLYKIGELESERDELKDKLERYRGKPLPLSADEWKRECKKSDKQKNYLLGELLFLELKLGTLYQ